ncbi:MAG: hypothetical protein Q8880_11490, partial [Bacteroidota bacterium]|nr:hypothetical protein [Bacteroidota bacterium]
IKKYLVIYNDFLFWYPVLIPYLSYTYPNLIVNNIQGKIKITNHAKVISTTHLLGTTFYLIIFSYILLI